MDKDGPPRPTHPRFIRKRDPDQFGKVYLRINEVARERGFVIQKGKFAGMVNRAEVQRRTGVADDTLFYLLRHPELTQQIHFWTLAKLCHGLSCTPADLLEYTPHGGGQTPLSDQYKEGTE